MKKVHVLYAHNCDMTRVLLVLNPNMDDETAVNAIFEAIKEVELYDIDENEYTDITSIEELKDIATSIWHNHESVYIDTRWEATYELATNVELLS